ncbi:WD40-repeat-containing domain protein [Entophlyctis helioformis]|nr:WD40-repeat-containing domain protein [Entophlyctis helioformis]
MHAYTLLLLLLVVKAKHGNDRLLWEPSGDTSQVVAPPGSEMESSLGSIIRLPREAGQDINCSAWNPHNEPQIAVGVGRTVSCWDIRSNSESYAISNAHELGVRSLDYNPNKPYHIATGGDDCHIRIWDMRNSQTPLKEISDHTHWVWAVAFNRSHDQLILSSAQTAQVNLHSAVSVSSAHFGDNLRNNRDLRKPATAAEAAASQSDEEGGDYRSKTTDGLVASFDQHEEAVYAVAWSPADPWIFASLSYDGRVVVNLVPRDHKYKMIL